MLLKHFYSTFSLLFILALFAANHLGAQSATFRLPNVTAQPGGTVCLPVTPADFSDLTEFGFTLNWNEEALSFTGIQNINPALNNFTVVNQAPGANVRGINTIASAAGLLTAYWRRWADGQQCSDLASGLTLADDVVLFEVCFTLVGQGYGDIQNIQFVGAPQPIIANKLLANGTCTSTTGTILGTVDGSITEGVDPLVMRVDLPSGNFQPGDLFCVDIVAESGFSSLAGLQFGLDWNKDILQVRSVIPNEDIPQNAPFNYNVNEESNCFSAAWTYFSVSEPFAVTIAPNTVFTQVCFEITGQCADQSPIAITESCAGAPVEAINLVNDINREIPVVTSDALFRINTCNPRGFDVVADCGDPIEVGQTVCVAVRAGDNFNGIQRFGYNINFDPSILQYVSQGGFNSTLAMNNGDFDAANVANGVLNVNYDSSPLGPRTLTAGAQVFEVCFTVIGYAPNTPISFSNGSVTENVASPPLVSMDPRNCAISIIQPDQVIFSFGSGGFSSTATDCIPVTVGNFQDINNLRFFIQYDVDGTLFDFMNVTNLALAGVNIAPAGAGLLQVTYNGAPASLADGALLFNLCLRAKPAAIPNSCSPIGVSTFPPPAASNTDGTINGILSNPGEGCVLFPEGFGLSIGSASMGIDSSVCIPVQVESFDNILSADFSFSFSPALLEFDNINILNWPGLSAANLDLSSANLGLIGISWTSPTAVAIPDSTIVFELCFNTLSTPDCAPLVGFSDEEPSSITTNGNGSILFTDGEVCVENRIKITEISEVVPSCVDVCNGKLVINAEAGGDEAGSILVRVDNPLQTRSVGDTIRNLCPGWVYFTIFNTGRPDMVLRDSIFLEFDETQVVTARARPIDPVLGCTDNASVALGALGNVGTNYSLFILTGQNRTLLSQGNINPDGTWSYFANSSGTYLLQVRNQAGCSAFDTVRVLPPVLPVAIAGSDTVLTCDNPEIVLTGEGSTTQGALNYRWDRVAGGQVVGTVGNALSLTVTEEGRYRLIVTYPQTMCSDSSIVTVLDNSQPPAINISGSATLACDGSPVMLDAGPEAPNLTYTWTDESNNIVSNSPLFSTDALGTYTIQVDNSDNGCSASRIVEVVPSTGAPVIAPTTPFNLVCTSDTLTIGVEASNVSASTTYDWSTTDGIIVIGNRTLPNPQIFGTGSYTVIVGNGGCADTATVLVEAAILPVVDLDEQVNLLCNEDLVIADNNAPNADYTYTWFTMGDTIPATVGNQLSVSQPGTYVLEAAINSTGCRLTDTIEVLAPLGFPVITLADTIFGLTCAEPVVLLPELNISNYSLSISGPGNPTVDPNNANQVLLDTPGQHTLSVVNTDNGCVGSVDFFVDGSQTQPPFVALTQPETSISCVTPTVLLDGRLSTSTNVTYTWSSEEGGEEPNMQGQDTLRVGTGGLYIFTATDTETGCAASDSIRVIDTRVFPVVDSLPLANLTCQNRSTRAAIQIADTTGLFIQWFGFGGLLATGVLSLDINSAGSYTAIVVNSQSSCVTQQVFRVIDEAEDIVEISFAPVDPFDCSVASVTLDASASLESPTPQDTITWTSLNGNTIAPATGSLIVTVDGPGGYVLTINSAGGCVATDTVFVEAANNTPFADAGEDIFISCGETPALGGMNTTAPALDTFLYAWTAISGGSILGAADGPTAIADGIGVYELLVTNIYNSCEDRDTVRVALDEQEVAMLPDDFTICEDNTIVVGNLPMGTTAVWALAGAGQAELSSAENTASLSALSGTVALTYTLSAPGCENYSSDTINITRESPPLAANDELFIQGNGGFGNINLLANDQRSGPVTVTLLDSLPFGSVTFLNGDFSFEAGQGVSGEFTIAYEICSNTCPDLCDQATLSVRVDAAGERPPVYNAITPNGDGLNETLIFDALSISGQEYPNNELIIFNRWGDIIYSAKPYNNDWNGVNNSGQDIPEGTYYYILRLDLGRGEIERGDITVIR